MLSPITIASSTRMPSTRIKAITLRVEIVSEKVGNNMMAPSSDIGTPAATHIATRKRRNNVKIIRTRRRPLRALRVKASRRETRSMDSSLKIKISIPSGNVVRNSGSHSLIPAAAIKMSSSPTRLISIMSAGSPLNCARRSTVSKPSMTRATSLRRTNVPSLRVRMMISSKSLPSYARPTVRRRISPPRVLTEPPGRSRELPRTAAATCSRVSSWRLSASSDTSIEIS